MNWALAPEKTIQINSWISLPLNFADEEAKRLPAGSRWSYKPLS
jgi:hypothetical protein